MTNAIETIAAALNEVFVEMDARVLVESQAWAKGRVAAIKEFKAVSSPKGMGQHEYYAKLFNIAGGKTWYNVFNGRNEAMIEEVMAKHCKLVAAKRNASIAAKLAKAEVTEVVASDFNRTSDGFNGTFTVETNKGRKVVTIETIYAGGYNIQCLHLRVLVKVR